MSSLEALRARQAAISGQPLYKFLGLKFTELKSGWAQFFQTNEALCVYPSGNVHPGALLTGADAAAGGAGWSKSPCVTKSLTTTFYQTADVARGPFIHSGRVLHSSNNIIRVECNTVNQDGESIMHTTGEFSVIDPARIVSEKSGNNQPLIVVPELSAMMLDDFLGYKFEAAAEGSAILNQPCNPSMNNGLGFLHGGMTLSLLNAAAEKAALSVVPENSSCVVTTCSAHFRNPGRQTYAPFKVTAEVLDASSKSVLVNGQLWDSTGAKLISNAVQEFSIQAPA